MLRLTQQLVERDGQLLPGERDSCTRVGTAAERKVLFDVRPAQFEGVGIGKNICVTIRRCIDERNRFARLNPAAVHFHLASRRAGEATIGRVEA